MKTLLAVRLPLAVALALLPRAAAGQSLPTAPDRGLAGLVPPDAVALFSAPDPAAAIEEIRALPLGRILAEAEVKDFLERPLAELTNAIAQGRAELQREAGLDPGPLLSTRWRAIEVAILRLRLAGQALDGGVAVRLDAGEGWPRVLEFLGRATDAARRDAGEFRVEEKAAGGKNWTLLRPANAPFEGALFWSREGTSAYLVAGSSGVGAADDLFARASGTKTASSLADDPDFQACGNRASGPPRLRAFLRVPPLLDALVGAVGASGGGPSGDSIRKAFTALGLDGIRAVAYSSSAAKDHWVNDAFVLAPAPRRGLLALSSGKPLDRELLKRVPADATSFSAGAVSIASLWDSLFGSGSVFGGEAGAIPAAIAEFEKESGVAIRRDLLGALGESYARYSMPSPSPFAPGEGATIVRLRDPVAFEKAAAGLAKALASRVPVVDSKETAHEGTTIRSFTLKPGAIPALPAGLPFNPLAVLSPAFAVKGDTLLFATNLSSLRRALSRMAGQPGAGAESGEGWQRFASRVPANASSIRYSDPRPTFEMAYGLATSLLPFAAQANLPLDTSAIPSIEALTGHLFGSVGYSVADAEGIHRRSFASFGADAVVLATGAMGAATATVVGMRSGGPSTPAPPARAPAELVAGLKEHTFEHVRLMTDIDDTTAKWLGGEAEAAYAKLRDLSGGEPKNLPLVVHAFATNAGYNRFAGSFGDDHSSVYGAYIATREASAPGVASLEERNFASLHVAHAVGHLFARGLAGPSRVGALPAWFEEGIATYAERYADPARRAWSIEMLAKRGGPGPLDAFSREFGLSADDHEGSQKRMLQAGIVIAYLVHGSDAKDGDLLRAAFRALREGSATELADAAAALVRDGKALEEKVRAFAP